MLWNDNSDSDGNEEEEAETPKNMNLQNMQLFVSNMESKHYSMYVWTVSIINVPFQLKKKNWLLN